jgi:hypothetical protein
MANRVARFNHNSFSSCSYLLFFLSPFRYISGIPQGSVLGRLCLMYS